ncbi:MAG: Exodeoxyribonuclease 7 large subunit [Candidatus Magasanikbacteria bacterium GW2011_GWA2_56_11]|uniref:Exodeoxyribonuclease 7 large subunit n=1 Tax=Candidatus Magasanikbacteria bacterium GW2011_GWA2_56_11 TaxID=1619044 RepID=A0A0G1YGZ8_9BACT|nr:MAG: Exodeoxyribonuclease 7 large subunit [Candidatus Magasanikbacteria bacterium GW2011_GWA2_56_11]
MLRSDDFQLTLATGLDAPTSVAAYLAALNAALRNKPARVIGEVGAIKIASSGHAYFSLRDADNDSVLQCVVWRSRYALYGVELRDGMQIVVSGTPEVYAPRGSLSFIVESLELVGEGALWKRYQELKQKLTLEGAFADERKRPLPEYIENVGVITSAQGAVIHDFLNNLGQFGFKIHFVDARVEGPRAAPDFIAGLRALRRRPLDAVVIMRGGGSLESLAGFDNELLVREIVGFPAPVIAGIGHHKDVPLAALAADRAVSTPTAVTQLLNAPYQRAGHEIARHEDAISGRYRSFLEGIGQNLDWSEGKIYDRFERSLEAHGREFEIMTERGQSRLESIFAGYDEVVRRLASGVGRTGRAVAAAEQTAAGLGARSAALYARVLVRAEAYFWQSEHLVRAHDPERRLRQGYSIVWKNGRVVKSAADVAPEDLIDIQTNDGSIAGNVIGVSRRQNLSPK